MTSPARIEANQKNAQKSTGPKTIEGKARSRMNALDHGLRAEQVVLPTEDPQRFDRHLGAWMSDWKPPTETRRFLVERAAVAAWRLDRCVRVESGRLSTRVNEAFRAWDKSRSDQLDIIEVYFPKHPGEAIYRLEQTRDGVGRLIDRWIEIMNALECSGGWDHEVNHHQRFVNLMGYTLSDPSDEAVALIEGSRRLILRNRPDLALENETALSDAEADRVVSLMLATIKEKFAILDEIHDTCPDETSARSNHAEQHAFAPRKEDAAFQRYEARHDREARAAIGLLMKLEKTGEDLAGLTHEAESTPEPEPIEPNEPKPAEPQPQAEAPMPNEPNAMVPVMPIPKADRDREGRIWPTVHAPEGSDMPRSL